MSEESSSAGRRNFLKVAVTAIVCGVVAGVGGWFAGSAVAPPPRTITEKVTTTLAAETVTKTVTPPPVTVTKTVTVTPKLPAKPVVVGFIGAMATDIGKATLRGIEIGIEELNERGGILGGRPLELVTADTHEDVHEGIKAYEYLATMAKADLIIAGCIDDVTLGWLPRVIEYKIPTISTWTSAIVAIDHVRKDPEALKSYFMLNLNDYYIGDSNIRYMRDICVKEMGWKTLIILHEDTSFGVAVADFVREFAAPEVGVEVVDQIAYDIHTEDFSPIFSKIEAAGVDFVWQITAANPIPITVQYVERRVKVPFVGNNAAALSPEFWEDTGGMGAGISCWSPGPSFASAPKLDPMNKKFYEKYVAKYKTRPSKPHFNSFHAYWALMVAAKAAERAGGFKPLDAWVEEMENIIVTFEKEGKTFILIDFWAPGEVDPLFDMTFPHAAKYDYENGEVQGLQGTVIQWREDGTAVCTWPPRFATGKFTLPPWIPK
jgi:ABC-type branched-subunit amino acid transport system substrate-binding protein